MTRERETRPNIFSVTVRFQSTRPDLCSTTAVVWGRGSLNNSNKNNCTAAEREEGLQDRWELQSQYKHPVYYTRHTRRKSPTSWFTQNWFNTSLICHSFEPIFGLDGPFSSMIPAATESYTFAYFQFKRPSSMNRNWMTSFPPKKKMFISGAFSIYLQIIPMLTVA